MNGDEYERALQSLFGGGAGINTIRLLPINTIDDYDTFLLSELPYGQVDPTKLNRGVVEWAGLERLDQKNEIWVALATNETYYPNISHWQFGRKMYPIVKAIRIQYSYSAPYGQQAIGSLLIGYQAPRITAYSGASIAALQGNIPPNTPTDELVNLTAAKTPRNASEALEKLVRNAAVANSNMVNDVSDKDIDEIIASLSPYGQSAAKYRQAQHIEVCGLARDNDSLHPFEDSWATVAGDSAKYEQLLHWSFASTSQRITKAMRVQFSFDSKVHLPPALMIGYQGPPHI